MYSEDILIIIMGVVVITTWIAASSKAGLYMFTLSSYFEQSRKKYRVKPEKRKPFMLYLAIALVLNVIVATLITRDIGWIAFFTVLNMVFIGNFLRYFVLLEPVKK